eukprot:scaffold1483_cov379-Prasinococcus_capsulatus_cf.AAC.12
MSSMGYHRSGQPACQVDARGPLPIPSSLSWVAGRCKQDLGRIKQEKQELATKTTALQAKRLKTEERLDQFRLIMNWNREELEQWALAARQKVWLSVAGCITCDVVVDAFPNMLRTAACAGGGQPCLAEVPPPGRNQGQSPHAAHREDDQGGGQKGSGACLGSDGDAGRPNQSRQDR